MFFIEAGAIPRIELGHSLVPRREQPHGLDPDVSMLQENSRLLMFIERQLTLPSKRYNRRNGKSRPSRAILPREERALLGVGSEGLKHRL